MKVRVPLYLYELYMAGDLCDPLFHVDDSAYSACSVKTPHSDNNVSSCMTARHFAVRVSCSTPKVLNTYTTAIGSTYCVTPPLICMSPPNQMFDIPAF